MPITVLKVRVSDLQPGMFVSSLDRPWLETPYPIQGFHIRSAEDRLGLQQFCDWVYVDVIKSKINSISKQILSQNEHINQASDAAQIYELTRRSEYPTRKPPPGRRR